MNKKVFGVFFKIKIFFKGVLPAWIYSNATGSYVCVCVFYFIIME